MGGTRSGRDAAVLAVGVALAAAAAAALRWYGLRTQVLVHDELHLVYAVVKLSLGEIARSWVYEGADYSVPLGLLFRSLRDAGVGLSELHFRAPMLAAGVIAVAAIPAAVRARTGTRAAVVLAWLLATSPLLVYYSRVVRSYMPLALVAFFAVWCAWRWRERRAWRFGAAYVACGALAIHLHLVAAPFVLAPMLLWIDDFLSSRSAAAARRDAAVAIALLAVVAALLWPARESIAWIVQNRRVETQPLAPGLGGALGFVAGMPPALGVALFFALLARGLRVGLATARAFHVHFATVCAAHVAAVFVLSPQRMTEADVFARYCIVLLPAALLWVAVGIATPWSVGPPWLRRAGPAIAGAVFAAIVVGQGILVTGRWRTPSFGNWAFFQRRDAPSQVAPDQMPAFYRQLGHELDAGVLLEAPWHHLTFTRMLAGYQRVHGQPILVSYMGGYPVNDPSLRLHTVVRPDPGAYLRSPARWLVVHRDPGAEERRFDPEGRLAFRADAATIEQSLRTSAGWAADVCRHLGETWGAPRYVDDRLCVWDLDAVREAGAGVVRLPQ